MTASKAWATFHSEVERQVAKQMAAPAEPRTPNLHRAKPSLLESADGSMATKVTRREKIFVSKRTESSLDSDRPSHGGRYLSFTCCGGSHHSFPNWSDHQTAILAAFQFPNGAQTDRLHVRRAIRILYPQPKKLHCLRHPPRGRTLHRDHPPPLPSVRSLLRATRD